MENKNKYLKATLLVALSAFLSRVLGLLRSILLSTQFGATRSKGYLDCYYASFKLPDIIYNLIAFGVFSVVLIPYFSQLLKKEDQTKVNQACSSFLNFFFVFLCFFLILSFFFTPYFVRHVLVTGWTDGEKINLTIKMTRIMLLQPIFMALSGIFGAYLHTYQRFKAYSLAMLSYNIGIILGILLLTPFMGIMGVAWGTVMAGFFHFTIQLLGALRARFQYSLTFPRWNQEIKQLIFIAIPRIIAISGEQLVLFFIVNFATHIIKGSLTIFHNAENFSMVPYGMIAVSISTTAFPIFSQHAINNDYNLLLHSLMDKIRSLLFFILPVILLMIICRQEIIEILLGYKHYQPEDVFLTAQSLAFYLMGIPFFSLTIVLVKFYYAQKKSFLPMLITLIMVAVTILSCSLLIRQWSVIGLSLGRAIGFIVQAILLSMLIFIINKREKKFTRFPWPDFQAVLVILLASFLMLTAGLVLYPGLTFSAHLKLNAVLKCVISGSFLALIYLAVCYLGKVPEVKSLFLKLFNKKQL